MMHRLRWPLAWWICFVAVNYALSDTVSLLIYSSSYVMDGRYWNMGLVAAGLLLGGGVLAAALVDTVLARVWREGVPMGGAVSVIAGFLWATVPRAANLQQVAISSAIPVVVLLVALWAAASSKRLAKVWFLLHPWTLALALSLRPLMYLDVIPMWSTMGRTAGSLGVLGLLVGLSWLLLRKGRPAAGFSQWAGAVVLLVAVLAGFAIRYERAGLRSGAGTAAASLPSIILITLDTTRADHLHAYGYPRENTPNLDEFARGATLYENAYSTESWTAPTHASIFTGMYPLRHGVRFEIGKPLNPIPGNIPTVTEMLAGRGYRTAGVVANNGFLLGELGFRRGFETYLVAVPWYAYEQHSHPSAFRMVRAWLMPEADMDRYFYHAAEIRSEAQRLLRAVEPGPSFVFLNFMDAHWPYRPPEPFYRRFGGPGPIQSSGDYDRLWRGVERRERGITSAEQSGLINAYDGAIAYLDSEVGGLFAELRASGQFDRSLIIVTADHGEAFGEEQHLGHGNSAGNYLIHVPLLIKYPGQKTGTRVQATVSGVDLAPTMLKAAEIPLSRQLAGIPLQDLAEGSTRPVFSESYFSGLETKFFDVERAVFQRGWKLRLPRKREARLFYLPEDPLEANSLLERQSSLAGELTRLLSTWQQNLVPVGNTNVMGNDALQRLRGLGYLQ